MSNTTKRLFFLDGDSRIRFVARVENIQRALDIAAEDLKRVRPGFKVYYYRFFENARSTWIDFGSHIEFYFLTDKTDAELEAEYGVQ